MSEEICSRSQQVTFNEEDFNNVQAAFMREESDRIVESQQCTTSDDEGLLKVLSFDSEVNITSTLADQSEDTSSQLCKKTINRRISPVVITKHHKTYERKSKRKIEAAVPNIIKAKDPKKNVDNNSSNSVKLRTIPQRQNENVDKESVIQNTESHLDVEDEYSLIKIKENMRNCSETRDKREESVSSDNVSSKTIIRKRGRPKKNISNTEKMKNKSKNNKSVIAKHQQSQGAARKSTRKVGRPRKAKIDKHDEKNTQSTFESVMEYSSLQSTNVDYTDKFENLKNVDDPVVENLKRTPGSLEQNTTDNTYYNNKTNNTCHSELKETPTDIEEEQSNKKQIDVNNDDCHYNNSTKRSSKMPVLPDFEYNIDSIVKESSNRTIEDRLSDTENQKQNTCSSAENICGRPQRRKNKHNLRYDECSDEDPFANVELSDDDGEPIRFNKNSYYSDDEYIPIKKVKKLSESCTSDSDIDKNMDELKIPRRRRKNTKSKKKEKKLNVYTLQKDTHQSEDKILTHDDNSQYDENNKSGSDNQNKSKVEDQETSVEDKSEEIENYLAKKIQGTNLKIKRVSNIEPTAITRLEIPVIDTYMVKKSVDACSQTKVLQTTSKSVQTTTAYDLGMKINVPLTIKQTEKACQFLKDILKTSSELGELMTQKSEDFIQKKINTKHVIDTFKMDYCVKKSFLLCKLAKHNLMEIEESLVKQYEDFLKENNLLQYREVPKSITPTLILSENDSDCEIIEESSETNWNQSKEKPMPQLNLKTVFLNKELSIKIAKKPSKEQ